MPIFFLMREELYNNLKFSLQDKQVAQKAIDKANRNLEQQCGIRPIIMPDNLYSLLESDEFWKALFGFATGADYVIDNTLVPKWFYMKDKIMRVGMPFVALESYL